MGMGRTALSEWWRLQFEEVKGYDCGPRAGKAQDCPWPQMSTVPGENMRSPAWLTVCPSMLGYKEGDERIPESRRLQQ